MIITNVIFAILSAMCSIYSMILYFKWKAKKDEYKRIGSQYSPWSFKGFWYRNKYQIALFLVFVFALISLNFIIVLI